jgi:phosphate butyryltransferase
MIRSLSDISRLALEKGPKKLAVLAPEDEEFMLAVKRSWEKGCIEPVLIGDRDKMARVAETVGFDISRFEQIVEHDRQTVSDLGIGMLFSGDVSVVSKGQITTSYVYRSIIRAEAKAASGMTVTVVSIWEVPGVDHLVGFTDSGVNIRPDFKTKVEILRNAVFLCHLLGYETPGIAVLSGRRTFGEDLPSYTDYESLRRMAGSGCLGDCEILEATSIAEIFLGAGGRLKESFDGIDLSKTPHIFLAPCLDTANILAKLDLAMDIKRCSISVTSRGAVCIPARSDLSSAIEDQIEMGVVVADRIQEGVR